MLAILVKALYLVFGLFVGYIFGRGTSSKLESYVLTALSKGERVVISVGEKAFMYEMVDGKLEVYQGTLESKNIDEDAAP